jgi:hypothetical protein
LCCVIHYPQASGLQNVAGDGYGPGFGLAALVLRRIPCAFWLAIAAHHPALVTKLAHLTNRLPLRLGRPFRLGRPIYRLVLRRAYEGYTSRKITRESQGRILKSRGEYGKSIDVRYDIYPYPPSTSRPRCGTRAVRLQTRIGRGWQAAPAPEALGQNSRASSPAAEGGVPSTPSCRVLYP